MKQWSHSDICLFLDFDGVLHPDYYHLAGGPPSAEAIKYFVFAPVLDEMLRDFPQISVVLSTTWGLKHGLGGAKAFLPAGLAQRTVGTTHELAVSDGGWESRSRYGQIIAYVEHHVIGMWIAVDDSIAGWPQVHERNLIATDPARGLGSPEAAAALLARLRELSQQSAPQTHNS